MSDNLFHVVDEAQVILMSGGVYRQVKVYQRSGRLYAAWGGGYIALFREGTSHPKANWHHLAPPPGFGVVNSGAFGSPIFKALDTGK